MLMEGYGLLCFRVMVILLHLLCQATLLVVMLITPTFQGTVLTKKCAPRWCKYSFIVPFLTTLTLHSLEQETPRFHARPITHRMVMMRTTKVNGTTAAPEFDNEFDFHMRFFLC